MLENNRDRGTKKWSMAMMLPEHVEALRNWMDEDHYVERPVLDDFDLQSIQYEIDVAFKRQYETHVAIWKDGEIIHNGGKIIEIHMHSRMLILDTPFCIERLDLDSIVGVYCKN
jgi:hypothetical protein